MHACVFACTMRVFLLSSACVSPYILELKIQILTTLKRFHLRRAGHCPRKLRQCAQLFLQAFFTAAQESIVAKVFRGPAFCCAHAAFRLVQAVGILFLTFFVFFVPGKTPAAGLVCEENKEERRQKMKRVGLRIHWLLSRARMLSLTRLSYGHTAKMAARRWLREDGCEENGARRTVR